MLIEMTLKKGFSSLPVSVSPPQYSQSKQYSGKKTFTGHLNFRVTLHLPLYFSENSCLTVFQNYLKKAVKKSSKLFLYVNASRESNNNQKYVRVVFGFLFSLISFCKADAIIGKKTPKEQFSYLSSINVHAIANIGLDDCIINTFDRP